MGTMTMESATEGVWTLVFVSIEQTLIYLRYEILVAEVAKEKTYVHERITGNRRVDRRKKEGSIERKYELYKYMQKEICK